MVFDFGVAGYRPGWLNGIDEITDRHGRRLRGLVGRRLTRTWVVWDDDDDEWFADCPVVLDFAGERVEVNHPEVRRSVDHVEFGGRDAGARVADVGRLPPAVARRRPRRVGGPARATGRGGGASRMGRRRPG
ncbi:hypothetical protein [Micromonospora sp. NPDC023644]|uniref:hypothetical protein n=1 Tax=Micromonospora sp. NPDC023644 TaxID=3154321 RepID=UPI0033DABA28